MGTKSRECIYGASVRAAAEQAAEARKTADRLACEAWNKRMLGFQATPGVKKETDPRAADPGIAKYWETATSAATPATLGGRSTDTPLPITLTSSGAFSLTRTPDRRNLYWRLHYVHPELLPHFVLDIRWF